MKLVKGISVLSAAILLAACGGSSSNDEDELSVPSTYTFDSKLIPGDSSVSHSGQATRQILINELKYVIGSDELQNAATKADALAMLNAVYAAGTTDANNNLSTNDLYMNGAAAATSIEGTSIKTTDAALKQDTFSTELVSGGKNLQAKIAGKDNLLTHKEAVGVTFAGTVGSDDEKGEGINAWPELLVQTWFDQIADLAVDGNSDTRYIRGDINLQQLVQKFVLGAVTYSQAAEDYLKADKGLLKQNTEADKAGKPYTSLEHQWDEGFGYFGAAHDYNLYTDAENKAQQDNDTNEDGKIDLYSEYSFGNSVNAAKRDNGSKDLTPTDFSKTAMDAFITGRAIIQANIGTNPVAGEGYHVELVAQAEIALNNWEKAIAATVVHYINDVIADMDKIGGENAAEFKVSDLQKHWAEMKGFALGLQFSPIALISLDQLKSVHADFGQMPVVIEADVAAYKAKLLNARATLATAYSFDENNVAGW